MTIKNKDEGTLVIVLPCSIMRVSNDLPKVARLADEIRLAELEET